MKDSYFHPISEKHTTKIIESTGENTFMTGDILSIFRDNGHIIQIRSRRKEFDRWILSEKYSLTELLVYNENDF